MATKYTLPESEIPTHWINLLPDLPGDPLPPLNPQTMQPAGPDDLTPIFPMGVILQEVSMETEVEIPDEVREVYKLGRSIPRRTSTTSTRASRRPARTSPTARWRRRMRTSRPGSSD
jgi:tryptophan synthase beta chain